MSKTVRIATRGSKLALWQAEHVRDRLRENEPDLEIELVIIKTKGDKILDVPLAKVGGKGLFVKEIEEALLDRRADLAVHSMKDVPAELAGGLGLAAISKRANPRDAVCTRDGAGFEAIPNGARVGTSSLRRVCQLRAKRPDLDFQSLRGNVPTRLAKLDAGEYEAIVLAAAGLERLGFKERISDELSPEVCLPAVGQGALAIETRDGDEETITRVRRAIHHETDAACVTAERAFLLEIQGGCQAPLAAHAVRNGEELVVDALIGSIDGTTILRSRQVGEPARAEELGRAAAAELVRSGGAELLAAVE